MDAKKTDQTQSEEKRAPKRIFAANTRHATQAGPKRIFAPHRIIRKLGGTIGHGDFPNAVLQGSTSNFQVYVIPELGAAGQAIARGVLANCERDYNTIKGYFGGITPKSLPFHVVIAQNVGGAYHYGCLATEIYCDSQASPLDPAFTSFLLMAEAVEVFSASQNLGWDCGAGNGEGLSRVLATALYPTEIQKPGLATAGVWLEGNRPNWVNRNANTDQDAVVNGCDVLFLNYLRYQLGYSWNLIVGAATPTLAKTYKKLTGKKNAFAPFKSLLDRHFPPGQPSNLMTDNPFPLQ